MNRTCSIDDCTRKHFGRGYCERHYRTWRTHGTPTPVIQKCMACDKPATSLKSSLCRFHDRRQRDGIPLDQPARVPGYGAMHDKLKVMRGRAADQACVGCGLMATDWALRDDAAILVHVGGANDGRIYSRNVFDYEPRCRICHTKYDIKNNLRKGSGKP
jgi:hypothetical protein